MLRPPPPTPAWIADRARVDTWPAGLRICRAHSHVFGSTQFDRRRASPARFSPLTLGRSLVPVLYGGEDDHAAASETIFHTVDRAGSSVRPRNVMLGKFTTWHWSTMVTTRPFRLVKLDGDGLRRLDVPREDLIEGGRATYPTTRPWAAALAGALGDVDGLWWRSRQDPDRWAVVLFGATRV
ncbi:MAG: RES family NAD+ phosphorylase, partial [Acidimicrobiales bacterium]